VPKYTPKDAYFEKAKLESFVARSIYKLEEIDAKYGVLDKGMRVVDLGCSPGSWLQYAAKVVGPKGAIIGYDIVPPRVELGQHIKTIEADVYTLTPERVREDLAQMFGGTIEPDARFDAFLSDMAPKTTGVHDTDQARSEAMVEAALALAAQLLRTGGTFVAKVFQGRGTDQLLNTVKQTWRDTRVLRPKATREGSREMFIITRAP